MARLEPASQGQHHVQRAAGLDAVALQRVAVRPVAGERGGGEATPRRGRHGPDASRARRVQLPARVNQTARAGAGAVSGTARDKAARTARPRAHGAPDLLHRDPFFFLQALLELEDLVTARRRLEADARSAWPRPSPRERAPRPGRMPAAAHRLRGLHVELALRCTGPRRVECHEGRGPRQGSGAGPGAKVHRTLRPVSVCGDGSRDE